jgi:hypothetical protein
VIALGHHYFKLGKLVWADAGGSIVVYLFNEGKIVFAGFAFPQRVEQLLKNQVKRVDLYICSDSILATRIEIPKDLLGLNNDFGVVQP